jgi:hypothetical protein
MSRPRDLTARGRSVLVGARNGSVRIMRLSIPTTRLRRSKVWLSEKKPRLGVRYWQRRLLFLHLLFNDKAQNQKRYWPNSHPNSQPLRMSFLQDRS